MSDSTSTWLLNPSSVVPAPHIVRDMRNILGVDVWAVTSRTAVLEVERGIDSGEHRKLSFLNAHGGNIAYVDPEYRSILKQFTVLSDGIGLDLGAQILYGSVFPDNLNGTEFIPRLFDDITGSRTVALLGARSGVADAAALQMSKDHPQHIFTVVGDGYFDNTREREILAHLEHERPDILLVALGNPIQEKWIAKNCDGRHAGVSIGVGALFDFASGGVPRAPGWMINNRLEWLYRLWLEPRRMWRRYVLGNPLFVARILRQRLIGPGKVSNQ